jgi:multidrug transporter EmrE-like cation transporter
MSTAILLILLFAAVCHAVWNALSKRIEERDAFFTLILGASVVLYLPLAVYLWQSSPAPPGAIKWLLLSTVSEVLYFVALAKAYQTNNLSHAYPILRGTAPIVTTLLSILLFGATVVFGNLGHRRWRRLYEPALVFFARVQSFTQRLGQYEMGISRGGVFRLQQRGGRHGSGDDVRLAVQIHGVHRHVCRKMDHRSQGTWKSRLFLADETVSMAHAGRRGIRFCIQLARRLRDAVHACNLCRVCPRNQHRLCHADRGDLAEGTGWHRKMGIDRLDIIRCRDYQAELESSIVQRQEALPDRKEELLAFDITNRVPLAAN